MCKVICRPHEDPPNGPMGDPSMVRLQMVHFSWCFLLEAPSLPQRLDNPSDPSIGDQGMIHLP